MFLDKTMESTTRSFSRALLKETLKPAGGKKPGIKLEPEFEGRNKTDSVAERREFFKAVLYNGSLVWRDTVPQCVIMWGKGQGTRLESQLCH